MAEPSHFACDALPHVCILRCMPAAKGSAHVIFESCSQGMQTGAHSNEAQGGGVGGGRALDAVNDEEAAGRTGQRASIDEVIQQLAGRAHRLEQCRPHRRVRLARHAHHYVPELQCSHSRRIN